MKKLKTLFKKDPNDLGRVIAELDPENNWVFDKGVIPTRKFDGSACAIIDGELYKRYDVKKGKQVPQGAIPCQDPDPITGHWPHWVKCDVSNPADKYFLQAFEALENKKDGTYEFCGPKSQGNAEHFDIEGIVFHHPDGRMCKIRKSDFGIRRK